MNPEVQVIMKSLNNKSKIWGWIQNISQDGFKVRVETSQKVEGFFERWRELRFETFEDFFQLRGQGRIVWISSKENMAGIRFDQLHEESRRFVDAFLGIFP